MFHETRVNPTFCISAMLRHTAAGQKPYKNKETTNSAKNGSNKPSAAFQLFIRFSQANTAKTPVCGLIVRRTNAQPLFGSKNAKAGRKSILAFAIRYKSGTEVASNRALTISSLCLHTNAKKTNKVINRTQPTSCGKPRNGNKNHMAHGGLKKSKRYGSSG